MRRDFPDYRTPILAYFRALGVWAFALVIAVVICGLVSGPGWLSVAVLIAFMVAAVAYCLWFPGRIIGAESRARAAHAAQLAATKAGRSARTGRVTTAAATPKPKTPAVVAVLVIRVCEWLGLPVLLRASSPG